eukprot:scaffold1243_cov118-Isochrysis_galbana.AAC.4
MLDTTYAYGADHHFHLCTTDGACERHPFLITAAEFAGEEPAINKMDTTSDFRQQTDRRAFALKRHASLSSPANKYIMAHQSLGPSYHGCNTTQEQSTGPQQMRVLIPSTPTWETHPQTITRRSTKSKLTTHVQTYARYFGTSVCVKPTPLNSTSTTPAPRCLPRNANKVTSRSRHITRRYLKVREYVADGIIIAVRRVSTDDNTADIFTNGI